jgi:hypothetical protein
MLHKKPSILKENIQHLKFINCFSKSFCPTLDPDPIGIRIHNTDFHTNFYYTLVTVSSTQLQFHGSIPVVTRVAVRTNLYRTENGSPEFCPHHTD